MKTRIIKILLEYSDQHFPHDFLDEFSCIDYSWLAYDLHLLEAVISFRSTWQILASKNLNRECFLAVEYPCGIPSYEMKYRSQC